MRGIMPKKKDWKSSVYHPPGGFDTEYWARIREIVITRDHLRCKSCLKRKLFNNLTVHHIIPRCEGGQDDPDNLITLCQKCHDAIEETDIRTASEIYGYMLPENKSKSASRNNHYRAKELEETLKRIDDARPDWHKYVYGGQRRNH